MIAELEEPWEDPITFASTLAMGFCIGASHGALRWFLLAGSIVTFAIKVATVRAIKKRRAVARRIGEGLERMKAQRIANGGTE